MMLLSLSDCAQEDLSMRESASRAASPSGNPTSRRQTPPANSMSLIALVDSLTLVHGEFRRQALRPYGYEFVGSPDVIRALRAYQADAVKALIGCLDREDLAAATLAGQRVRVGIMCYHALTSFTYVERTDENGDSDPNWVGYVDASAGIEQLRAAKREWERLLDPPGYIMMPGQGDEVP